jgi:hypothetical protein
VKLNFDLQPIAASADAKEEIAILYCIAYNELNKRKWLAAKDAEGKKRAWELKFHYLHAVDQQHARFEFIMARPNKSIVGVDIVSISPAIGSLAKDSNGDERVADCLTK